MTFENTYNDLVKSKIANTALIENEASRFVQENDYKDANKWITALALCDAALQNNIVTDTIKELYRQMYYHSWCHHPGMSMNDDDYAAFFNACKSVNEKFIAIGHPRAYVEQADLFENTRRPYRDMATAIELLKKGIDLGDVACMCTYGYYLYYGVRGVEKADKEKGFELIKKSKELGYERANLYLLYIDFGVNDNNDDLLAKINEYISTANDDNKIWYLLADFYFRINEFEKAKETLEKGIANHEPYSKYLMGMNILNGRFENQDKAHAIQLLEEAYDFHNIYAANFLGQYYYYANDENSSVEKAIEWYNKGIAYYSETAAYNLSLIYLYNDNYKDLAKGMQCLDIAIEDNHARAHSEKAYLHLEHNGFERNIPYAKELLEKAMELGDDYAPYRLGRGYQNAEFSEESDYVKALELYLEAAARGHVYGMDMVGRYYRVGIGCEPDAEKAIAMYRRAIDECNSDYSRVELAFCYEASFGVEQNYEEAFKLYEQAAANGYAYANVKLGYYYQNGLVGQEDVEKAFECFKKAADEGLGEGEYNVGRYYKYGIGVAENPQLALEYFRKAADNGDMDAYIELALCYEHEYGGLEFDANKAMEYMTVAAQDGIPYAQYKLGCYHYFGMIETDMEKGMEWLVKAYDNGSGLAALTIGDHYLYNYSGEKEYDKAFEYYKRAEETGYISEGMGICYEYGIGVEENNTEAYKYYGLGADRGYTAAKYRLGMCYKRGTGTNKNMSEAYNWLLQAANEGNRSAKYEIGMMLLNGEGTSMNAEEGVNWLVKAAEEDHDDAQLALGNCYLTGCGVAEDEVQAMYWFQKSAENGNEQALKITGRRERKRR